MIYPFFWPHIFVPIVPRKMLDMCCAPMPFIAGVMTQHLSIIYLSVI